MKTAPEWLDTVKSTYKLHISKVKECEFSRHRKWKISDTAREQKRSIGMVSEDLLIAQWLKTHSAKIEEFEFRSEALEFIRKRKHHLLTEGSID